MSELRDRTTLGKWGPFTVERTVAGKKLGWVITIRDRSGERVEVRTTPKGQGMHVSHVLFDGMCDR